MRLLWRAAPYLVAVLALLGGVLFVWLHGYGTANERAKAAAVQVDLANAKAVAALEAKVRQREQESVKAMAALAAQHQTEIENEIISRDRTIADLRSGVVRVRDRFACPATQPVPSTAAATGQRDGGAQGGLQAADVELVLRIASDADQVANQLRACQAVVRGDRGQP